jgi:hypothetical protein
MQSHEGTSSLRDQQPGGAELDRGDRRHRDKAVARGRAFSSPRGRDFPTQNVEREFSAVRSDAYYSCKAVVNSCERFRLFYMAQEHPVKQFLIFWRGPLPRQAFRGLGRPP